ncbi:hypothetical protein ABZZ79_02635 [Streptomyces sp. NPDC006458]|uniref:hypothetical protein n=1 Tax=Streptomyces sp. NPDC006458 TaxID=3154302 RepID=UPI0033BBA3F1
MRTTASALIALALSASSLLLTGPAGARPEPVTRPGPALDTGAADLSADSARRALTDPAPDLAGAARGYPRRQVLAPEPENPADRSLKLGLVPYHGIAPRLNALQALGDRVSVEVTGRSAGGHRLYLVTVTAPESAARARAQERMRVVVSGPRAVLFGTEPLFRAHPKGEFPQVARALLTMAQARRG